MQHEHRKRRQIHVGRGESQVPGEHLVLRPQEAVRSGRGLGPAGAAGGERDQRVRGGRHRDGGRCPARTLEAYERPPARVGDQRDRDRAHRGAHEPQQVGARHSHEGARGGGAHRGVEARPVRPRVHEHRSGAEVEAGQEQHVEIRRHRHEHQHAIAGADPALGEAGGEWPPPGVPARRTWCARRRARRSRRVRRDPGGGRPAPPGARPDWGS